MSPPNLRIENLVFTNTDAELKAVFDVVFEIEDDYEEHELRVSQFRYFQPHDGGAYVAPPAIKTDRGYVRPVAASAKLCPRILVAFNDAWDLLSTRRLLSAASNQRSE